MDFVPGATRYQWSLRANWWVGQQNTPPPGGFFFYPPQGSNLDSSEPKSDVLPVTPSVSTALAGTKAAQK